MEPIDLPACPRCDDTGEVCEGCGWSERQCKCPACGLEDGYDYDPCPDCEKEAK